MKDQPKFQFKKIRTKLLVLTLSVSIVSLGLVLAITSISTYNNTMKTLEATLSETASVATGQITCRLDGVRNLVSEISNNTEISSNLPKEQVIAGLKTIAEEREYAFLRRTDAAGVTYDGAVDVSDREYFQICKSTGKPYVSDPLITKDTQERVLVVASPITKDGAFDGVIIAAISSSDLSKMVQAIKVGETGTAYILDKSGLTIAAYDESIVENEENVQELAKTDEDLKQLAVYEADMCAGNVGFGEYKYDGSVELTSYAPIAGTNGWSLAICTQKSEFINATYQTLFLSLAASFVILCIAAFIYIRFASSISKPITAINEEMMEFGKGNFSTDFWMKPDSTEIGQLTTSIISSKRILKEIIDDTALGCQEMAQGNFDIHPKVEYLGEFKEIETAMKQITHSLSDTLGQINVAAEQVSFGSDQVSSGAQALAQGSTEQAGTAEELSSNISIVANQVEENAANATHANESLVLLGQEISKSNSQMQQLTEAMTEISSSSQQIEKIIKTIEDIAFQTNILALNAAVEAARAGSAGKGFAVVADEVRNLASKSAEAAKNTTALIESSILAVKNGTNIADQTEQSLASVVEDSKAVTLTVEKITKASNEQATSLNQITQGMEQITSVVQSNSATSEESAAAAQELSGQAQMLKGLVSNFRLKNTNDLNMGSTQTHNFNQTPSFNQSFETVEQDFNVLDDFDNFHSFQSFDSPDDVIGFDAPDKKTHNFDDYDDNDKY